MPPKKKYYFDDEEYLSPGSSYSDDGDRSENYDPTREYKNKSRPQQKAKSLAPSPDDSEEDEDLYIYSSIDGTASIRPPRKARSPRPPRPSTKKIKTDVSIISQRNCFANQMSEDDPQCRQDPDGNPCRFIPFSELKPHLLNLDEILEKDEKGINTLLRAYDPVAQNKLQFFSLDDSFVRFDSKTLESMSLDELKSELEATEKDLEQLPLFPEFAKDFVIIPPYDENIKVAAPIQADVRHFNWHALASIAKFDVIVMDPPWNITPSQTTRGVDLGYQLMPEEEIAAMPIEILQDNGYCFMWVVASMLPIGIDMLKKWGYKVVDFVNWIKTSKYGRYKPSNGYFFQHTKETCLVGVKGTPIDGENINVFEDTIVEERGARQSHKPPTLYEIIERMFPGRMFLEIFARAHNQREGWVSIGLEIPN